MAKKSSLHTERERVPVPEWSFQESLCCQLQAIEKISQLNVNQQFKVQYMFSSVLFHRIPCFLRRRSAFNPKDNEVEIKIPNAIRFSLKRRKVVLGHVIVFIAFLLSSVIFVVSAWVPGKVQEGHQLF